MSSKQLGSGVVVSHTVSGAGLHYRMSPNYETFSDFIRVAVTTHGTCTGSEDSSVTIVT
jgi:hypothetical protein